MSAAKWKLSDGTAVSLGGRVTGDSPLAAELRRDALAVKAGYGVPVQWDAPPGGTRPLGLDDAQLVDLWVRAAARRYDATVTSAPEVEPRDTADRSGDDDPEDVIY